MGPAGLRLAGGLALLAGLLPLTAAEEAPASLLGGGAAAPFLRRAQEAQGGTPQPPDSVFPQPDTLLQFSSYKDQLTTYLVRAALLLLVGALYFCCIASRYPKLMGPSETSMRLQAESELCATCQASCPNCFYSYFCSGARAAHTFDAAGVCDYWPSLVLMTLLPCCTLYYMNSCTSLNERLGGRRKDCCMGLLCTFFCSCCVIAQDAESLDMATGARTGLCGVETPPMNMMYNGANMGMGPPGMMQMQQQYIQPGYPMPGRY